MGAEEPTVSLLELARSKVKKPGGTCTFKHLLPDAEIEELLANVGENGARLPYKAGADALAQRLGRPVKGDTVSRHVRGECNCNQ
jgi:hypothetical protein